MRRVLLHQLHDSDFVHNVLLPLRECLQSGRRARGVPQQVAAKGAESERQLHRSARQAGRRGSKANLASSCNEIQS